MSHNSKSMLPLDDLRWQTYKGGYHLHFDATPFLRELYENGLPKERWLELWDELHHQGDVDSASYAVVPHLLNAARLSRKLDWNCFGLLATVELCRMDNSAPPPEIADGYFAAIESAPAILCMHADHEWNELLTVTGAACIALARGNRTLGNVLIRLTDFKAILSEELGIDWQ